MAGRHSQGSQAFGPSPAAPYPNDTQTTVSLRSHGRSSRRPRSPSLILVVGLVALLVSGYALAATSAAQSASSPTLGHGSAPSGVVASFTHYPCISYKTEPVLSVSPTVGPAGTNVWVNGTGFYPEGGASIYWVSGSLSTGTYLYAGSASLSFPRGNFSTQIPLPPVGPGYPVGTYNVSAEDTNDACAAAEFSLTTASVRVPQLTIEYPTSGLVQSSTSVEGSYFFPGATIDTVQFGGTTVACVGGAPVVATNGAFTCTFTVPNLPPGSYYVTTHDSTDGWVTSTNTFTDDGGFTGTAVACAPSSVGVSPSTTETADLVEYSTNCTATVTGASPTGTVTWSSNGSTDTFFTWTVIEGFTEVTTTSTCTLNSTAQCTISYSDSALGSRNITASYGGDYFNAVSEGSTLLPVVAVTIPTVTAACSPAQVAVSTVCTAVVTGNSPTGLVNWQSFIPYLGREPGSFSSPTCTLTDGNCSVTWYSGAFTQVCGSPGGLGCATVVSIDVRYLGDALNAPAFNGNTSVSWTATSDEYGAYTSGVSAQVGSTYNVTDAEGGYGTQTVAASDSVTAIVGSGDDTLTASAGFSILGSAPAGEVAGTGAASNGGQAFGSVSIEDTSVVTGTCDLSSDPTNLGPCLTFSVSAEGSAHALCPTELDKSCTYALAGGLASFEACDISANEEAFIEGYGGVGCASGTAGGEACVSGYNCVVGPYGTYLGYGCPIATTMDSFFNCNTDGGTSLTFAPTGPATFPSTNLVPVRNGDTIVVSASLSGFAYSSAYGAAGLSVDPTLEIGNLDPAGLTVSVLSGEIASETNSSTLKVVSTVAPNPVKPGGSLEDSSLLTNDGPTDLTGVAAVGSMDGPLSCPSSTLAVGANETCSGTFSAPFVTGPQTDFVVANGTNSTDAILSGGSSAPFNVTAPTSSASLSISPGQGPAGAKVTVTGRGFSVDTPIAALVFDWVTVTSCTSGSLTTGTVGPGAFGCTFAIPGGTSGTTVTATDLSGAQATAKFTVTTPTLSASPYQGPVGATVTVVGHGFLVDTPLASLVFDGVKITSCLSGSLTTGQVSSWPGGFSCTFPVPSGTSETTVTATDVSGAYATTMFTVTTPTLSASPYQGPVGATVNVTGHGFSVRTPVGSLVFDGVTISSCQTGSLTTGQFPGWPGGFSCTFPVPSGTSGTTVTATDVVGVSATATFTVTTPTLSTSSHQGPVRATVTVVGHGFSVDTPLASLVFDGVTITSCVSGTLATGVVATWPGGFNCTFLVPSGTSGTTVTATDVSGAYATAKFTVTAPTLAVSPAQGPVGATVTVVGHGFSADTPLASLVFDGVVVTNCLSGSLTTEQIPGWPGGFSCTFLVPSGTSGASVTATDVSGAYATAKFTVT